MAPTTTSTETEFAGRQGRIVVRRWAPADPAFIVLLAHGYGEHGGRYEHVAARLVDAGAAVYAPDHAGHGRSEGEQALIHDVDDVVADLHTVATDARTDHPGRPLVVLGHSMGGLLATRFVQQHAEDVDALVLSGPAIGANPDIEGLLALDPIPDVPIDPAVLSRDPAVGRAYAEDPLVYHGPFKRATLEAMFAAAGAVAEGPAFGDSLPVLWVHGEDDALVPIEGAREAMERLRGARTEEKVYPGARHEIFNETNSDEVIADVVAFVGRALA